MARVHGTAGWGVRRMGLRDILKALAMVAALFVVLWVVLRHGRTLPPLAYVGILGGLLVAARTVLERTDARAARMARGAHAEDAVESALSALDDDYDVLHDLVIGNGNIDHVVIGPGGVFTIETKSHRGTVTSAGGQVLLNGRPPEKDFARQAYAEAMTVKDFLCEACGSDVYVQPLLVFTEAFVKVPGPVSGVRVLPLRWLLGVLTEQSGCLRDEARACMAEALAPLTSRPLFVAESRAPSRTSRVVRHLCARGAGLAVVGLLCWWLFLGGGIPTMTRWMPSGDGAPQGAGPSAQATGSASGETALALSYLETYAPEQYALVANRDEPRVTPVADGRTEYLWEWVDAAMPSQARVRTVTILVGPDGSWAGLSVGD